MRLEFTFRSPDGETITITGSTPDDDELTAFEDALSKMPPDGTPGPEDLSLVDGSKWLLQGLREVAAE